MNEEPNGFFKRKTTWAALFAIFGAVGGALTGTVSIPEAVTIGVQAVLALGLRSAIASKPA